MRPDITVLDNMSEIQSCNFNFLLNWSKKYDYVYNAIPKSGSTSILYLLQQIEMRKEIKFNHNDVHDKKKSCLLSPNDDMGWFRRYHPTFFLV